MELKQKVELRRLLIPELNQSLKVLSLPLLDLKAHIENELINNPFLEEVLPQEKKPKLTSSLPFRSGFIGPDSDFRMGLITKKLSLQDILLRQLGMFADTDEEFKIGQEIIGNIDENGYLKADLQEFSTSLNTSLGAVEKVLKLIQQFEPAGVAARSIPECMLIQLELANEKDPLLVKIIERHLDDVAKKNYCRIAKSLNEPLEKIEPLIRKILRLDPKPGRNFSTEETQHVVPDIIISDKGDELDISINDEDIPTLNISKDYKKMLKNSSLEPQAKGFLTNQLHNALALMRAVFRRKTTLRKIVETIVEIQQDAIRNDLSQLKPLIFQDVAKITNMHESTVCRAIMNKYVKLPFGVVALKDFFSNSVQDKNGQAVSSNHVLRLIKELIDQEDKKHPLSDHDIAKLLLEKHNLNIPRRTLAKYRDELKILSSCYRRER